MSKQFFFCHKMLHIKVSHSNSFRKDIILPYMFLCRKVLMWAKHIIGNFEGLFRGCLNFLDPKIALCSAQDNLEVKKDLPPSKNPPKSIQICELKIRE
jgi:hypothetical protein